MKKDYTHPFFFLREVEGGQRSSSSLFNIAADTRCSHSTFWDAQWDFCEYSSFNFKSVEQMKQDIVNITMYHLQG